MSPKRSALLLLTGIALISCDRGKSDAVDKPIGSQLFQLRLWYGGTWSDGLSVDINPGEYAVVISKNCPSNREPADVRGICVIRVTEQESNRIERAMEPFKKSAIPLASFKIAANTPRPDGKPCREHTTDSALVSFTWTQTDGSKIASFDTGCDADEFKDFYRSAFAVRDLIPIQRIAVDARTNRNPS